MRFMELDLRLSFWICVTGLCARISGLFAIPRFFADKLDFIALQEVLLSMLLEPGICFPSHHLGSLVFRVSETKINLYDPHGLICPSKNTFSFLWIKFFLTGRLLPLDLEPTEEYL